MSVYFVVLLSVLANVGLRGSKVELNPVFWANAAFLLAGGVLSAKDRRSLSSDRLPERPRPGA
jgi:hypothetical protein